MHWNKCWLSVIIVRYTFLNSFSSKHILYKDADLVRWGRMCFHRRKCLEWLLQGYLKNNIQFKWLINFVLYFFRMLCGDINIQVVVSSTEHYCGLSLLNSNFYLKNRATDTNTFGPFFQLQLLCLGILFWFWFVGVWGFIFFFHCLWGFLLLFWF